ncbi:MAG: hypothetical protein GY841_00905, partial [FCB group bacterium]|nr:hypothetical protein [FCB group bacterium]
MPGTCIPTPTCDGTCEVYNDCTQQDIQCCDPVTEYCDADACVTAATCDSFEFGGLAPDGDLGDPCSSEANSQMPRGDGTDLICDCDPPPGWNNMDCEGDGSDQIGTCVCA